MMPCTTISRSTKVHVRQARPTLASGSQSEQCARQALLRVHRAVEGLVRRAAQLGAADRREVLIGRPRVTVEDSVSSAPPDAPSKLGSRGTPPENCAGHSTTR